jgi:single-strand DNA-binding protein
MIAGHLGADPEVRFTSSGKKVTTLRVAARARGSKDETIWWKVTIWEEQFDKMMPYLKKGSPVIVAGELSKPEIFTDREGKPQISMNITASNLWFSPFGRPDASHHDNHAAQGHGQGHGQGQAHAAPAEQAPAYAGAGMGDQMAFGQGKPGGALPFSDDEIPF